MCARERITTSPPYKLYGYRFPSPGWPSRSRAASLRFAVLGEFISNPADEKRTPAPARLGPAPGLLTFLVLTILRAGFSRCKPGGRRRGGSAKALFCAGGQFAPADRCH